MPSEISSLVRSSASRSASVKATSSSAVRGKPSCCQSSSATSRGTPARSATSRAGVRRVRAEQRPVDVLDRVERLLVAHSPDGVGPQALLRGAVERLAEGGDLVAELPDGVAGEVQHLELGQADDRGGAQRVVHDRRLAQDVAGAEPGDLLAAAAHRHLAGEQDVGLVGRGLLPDRRPVGRQGDEGAGVLDPVDLVVGESIEDGHAHLSLLRFTLPRADPCRPLTGVSSECDQASSS